MGLRMPGVPSKNSGNILISSLIILSVGMTTLFIMTDGFLKSKNVIQDLNPAGLNNRQVLLSKILRQSKKDLSEIYCKSGKSLKPIFDPTKELPFSSKNPKLYKHNDQDLMVERVIIPKKLFSIVKAEDSIQVYLEENEDPATAKKLKDKTFRIRIETKVCRQELTKTISDKSVREPGTIKSGQEPKQTEELSRCEDKSVIPPVPLPKDKIEYVAFLNTDSFSCPSTCTAQSEFPKSCADLLRRDPTLKNQDGVYEISPTGDPNRTLQAHCDMTTDGGGWTLFGHMTTGGIANYSSEYGTNPANGNVIASKPNQSVSRIRVTGTTPATSCTTSPKCVYKKNSQPCSLWFCQYPKYSGNKCSIQPVKECTTPPKNFSFDLKESAPTPEYKPVFDIKRIAGVYDQIISQSGDVNINLSGGITFSTENYSGTYAMLAGGVDSKIGGTTYNDGKGQGLWWAITHQFGSNGYYCRNTMDLCKAADSNNAATGNIASKLELFYRENLEPLDPTCPPPPPPPIPKAACTIRTGYPQPGPFSSAPCGADETFVGGGCQGAMEGCYPSGGSVQVASGPYSGAGVSHSICCKSAGILDLKTRTHAQAFSSNQSGQASCPNGYIAGGAGAYITGGWDFNLVDLGESGVALQTRRGGNNGIHIQMACFRKPSQPGAIVRVTGTGAATCPSGTQLIAGRWSGFPTQGGAAYPVGQTFYGPGTVTAVCVKARRP